MKNEQNKQIDASALEQDLAKENPERALIGKIDKTTIDTFPEVIVEIKKQLERSEVLLKENQADDKTDTPLTEEILEGIKEAVNKQHLQLLDQTLIKHHHEDEPTKGYKFYLISKVKDFWTLLRSNPYINEVDEKRYKDLWKISIEPQAVEMFIKAIKKEEIPSKLEVIQREVEDFPFSEDNQKDEIVALVNDRITEVMTPEPKVEKK